MPAKCIKIAQATNNMRYSSDKDAWLVSDGGSGNARELVAARIRAQ